MDICQQRWNISDRQKDKLILQLVPELKTLRVKINITQEDLAQIIGISRQTYCQIECGNRNMSWNIYLSLVFFFSSIEETSKLMNALGVYPNDFVKQINRVM